MTADLHSRIAVEIERRLAVARAATPGPWTTSGPDTIAQWTIYDRQWSVASATAYDHDRPLSNRPDATGPGYIDPDANAAHIAMADPADAERRYSAALRVLNRHRACENGGLHGHAVLPWCDLCWTAHPCPEVLDVGAGLDITEGSTTDG